MALGKKKLPEGLNVCMNYEFNLLHHVGVVAKRLRAAAETHEGDDNTPSDPFWPRSKKSRLFSMAYTTNILALKGLTLARSKRLSDEN